MARGLLVAVHKSGSTWSYLAGEDMYGSSYTSAEETVEALAKILDNRNTWNHYSIKSIERAKELTFERFIERASQLIKKILLAFLSTP